MISGYAGGRIDSLMMRGVDVLYSLPFIIFVILLMVFYLVEIFFFYLLP